MVGGCRKLRCGREEAGDHFNYVDSLRKVSNLKEHVAESCQKREVIDRLISSLFCSPGPQLTPAEALARTVEQVLFATHNTIAS